MEEGAGEQIDGQPEIVSHSMEVFDQILLEVSRAVHLQSEWEILQCSRNSFFICYLGAVSVGMNQFTLSIEMNCYM